MGGTRHHVDPGPGDKTESFLFDLDIEYDIVEADRSKLVEIVAQFHSPDPVVIETYFDRRILAHLAARRERHPGEVFFGCQFDDFVMAFQIDLAGEQFGRRTGEVVSQRIDAHLLQIRIIDPQGLAVRNDQLLVRLAILPAKLPRFGDSDFTFGRLQ